MTNLTLVANEAKRKTPIYVFPAGHWVRLEAFLATGTNGAAAVRPAVAENGLRAVRAVLKSHEAGNARVCAALFTLAVAVTYGDERTRRAAYRALAVIARTGEELARFVDFIGELKPGPLAAA